MNKSLSAASRVVRWWKLNLKIERHRASVWRHYSPIAETSGWCWSDVQVEVQCYVGGGWLLVMPDAAKTAHSLRVRSTGIVRVPPLDAASAAEKTWVCRRLKEE